jgi:hypothetical protein
VSLPLVTCMTLGRSNPSPLPYFLPLYHHVKFYKVFFIFLRWKIQSAPLKWNGRAITLRKEGRVHQHTTIPETKTLSSGVSSQLTHQQRLDYLFSNISM